MKQKDFVYILVSIFILTVIWIAGNVYHNFVTTTLDETLQQQIIPIKPSFDLETIDRVTKREQVDPGTVSQSFDFEEIDTEIPIDNNQGQSSQSSEINILEEISSESSNLEN